MLVLSILLTYLLSVYYVKGNNAENHNHVGESCDNGQGICIDINTQQCMNGSGSLKTGYCPGPNNILCCEPPIQLPERCLISGGPPLLPNSYEFTLENQGFAGHPGALVYIPSNFHDVNLQGLELTIYIHGYNNCIRNIVRATEDACNCTANQDIRDAYNLIEQFEYAVTHQSPTKQSGYKQIFIAAEVAYDQANDSPGRWKEEGMLKAFLNELFTKHMNTIIGDYTLEDMKRIRIVSHSGGYYTIGYMATVGGMNEIVYELTLFDSLYANFAQFDQFVTSHLSSFGVNTVTEFRFSSLFTTDGGTYNNNLAMEERAKTWVQTENCTDILSIDNTLSTLPDQEIIDYSLVFKLSNLSHNDIPRYNFQQMLLNEL